MNGKHVPLTKQERAEAIRQAYSEEKQAGKKKSRLDDLLGQPETGAPGGEVVIINPKTNQKMRLNAEGTG